jgi:prepilin-type processing-associated H-X9-DG protein
MQPNFSDHAVQTVSIGDGRRVLRVTFSDGRALDIGADHLRMQCRCATCTRARIDGTFAPAEGLEIVQVAPIGQYAVNLAFSDGHVRGIFPFAYLMELAAFQAIAAETPVDVPNVFATPL